MTDLSLSVDKLRNVGTRNSSRLRRLGIKTLKDLLWHFPARYDDYTETVPISDTVLNQKVNIQGEIVKISTMTVTLEPKKSKKILADVKVKPYFKDDNFVLYN